MYANTVITVSEVHDHFDTDNWVILTAPMQSGKTSCYVELARKMKRKGQIDSVYVISGINDNHLKDQTYQRVKDIGGEVLFLKNVEGKVRGVTPGSASIPLLREFRSSLIIIDESHVGANVDGKVHAFLAAIGISPDGTLDKFYEGKSKRPYVLSVSATAYAECAASTISGKKVVYHIPGVGYVGLDSLDLRQINHRDPKSQLEDVIAEHSESRTYCIIRQGAEGNKNSAYIQEATRAYPHIPVIRCDKDNEKNLATLVDHEPREFTIILIKNFAKAGYTLKKRWLSFVWETYAHTDSQAQGLPGRCCGYHGDTHVQVYCYKDMLGSHINWNNSLSEDPESDDSRSAVPNDGHNVKPGKSLRDKLCVDPSRQKVGVYRTIQEVRDHYHEYGYQSAPTFSVKKDGVTRDEMPDDRGCLKQYLPSRGNSDDTVCVRTVEEIRDYLTDKYPLLNAKNIDDPDGGEDTWKEGKVAKIGYLDPEDPSTKRYILYHYKGPVWKEKLDRGEVVAVTTDKSMYVHKSDPLCLSNAWVTCPIPDDATDDQAIGLANRYIYGNISCIFARKSELSDIARANIGVRVHEKTMSDLGWHGYITPSLTRCLWPIIKARKENKIEPYIPSNQVDGAVHLVKTLCKGRENAKTGEEIDMSPLKKQVWRSGWKTPPSKVLCRKGLPIEKDKLGRLNMYYV